MLAALLCREWKWSLRSSAEIAAQLTFALLITSLFPLALGAMPETLRKFAPGLLSLALLLTQFLGFDRLFAEDWQEGTLDLIAMSRLSLTTYALMKTFMRWITHATPLLLLSPLLALLLSAPIAAIPQILCALTLASLSIHLAGATASALTLGAPRGFLLPLLLAPLCAPILIFCVSLAENGFGQPAGTQSALFLAALFLLYLCLGPPLAGAALRSAVEAS